MKTIQLRSIIPVIALLLAGISPLFQQTLSAQSPAGERSVESPKVNPTVVVNITRGMDDLHAACMGIGLASNAIKAGRRAIIFLNVHAPVLATADLSADVKFADFPPVKEMLAKFVTEGGELYVCGHCAAVCKVEESNLIKGAVVSHHEDLFKKLPNAALTFSY
jgi:predicted peroxiredoxin